MPHDFNQRERVPAERASAEGKDGLPGIPNTKFIFAVHPDGWEYDEEHGFIPKLQKHPLRPGVNGHTGQSGGVPRVTSKLREEGWTVLDSVSTPVLVSYDGELVEEQGYLIPHKGQRGTFYGDCWAQPHVQGFGRSQSVVWHLNYDSVGRKATAAMLRDRGIVPPIKPMLLDMLVRRQGSRSNRRVHEAHDGNPHVQKHVQAERERFDRMKAAAEDISKPKPAAKRRRNPKRESVNG